MTSLSMFDAHALPHNLSPEVGDRTREHEGQDDASWRHRLLATQPLNADLTVMSHCWQLDTVRP